jgi:hypothetical protein
LKKAAGWGYNLEGSQFVVIDTDNEEARTTLISRFPMIEETLKTINSSKKGSCPITGLRQNTNYRVSSSVVTTYWTMR